MGTKYFLNITITASKYDREDYLFLQKDVGGGEDKSRLFAAVPYGNMLKEIPCVQKKLNTP